LIKEKNEHFNTAFAKKHTNKRNDVLQSTPNNMQVVCGKWFYL